MMRSQALPDTNIRRAHPDEAPALSAIAFRSKTFWGYPADFMEACREELTLSPSYLRSHPTYVLEDSNVPRGFYSLEHQTPDTVELTFLFVDSPSIGAGFGRRLMQHAVRFARGKHYRTMRIVGDPNAERFYRAAGGKSAGTEPSRSIPGRRLPVFVIDLSASSTPNAGTGFDAGT